MKMKTTPDRMMNSILITGIVIACFYWVCESFMYFFMAPEANIFQHLLGPNLFQTFTRVLVRCLLAIFGSHIQYTLNKERKADEALRVSEEKYRNIIESIEEGYFETDLRDNLTFFNPPLARILGYSVAELQGKNTRDFTTQEAAAAAEATLEKVVKTGEPASVVDYKVIQKDGEPKDLELSVSLIRDAAGRPAGFRGVVRDVSGRKRDEGDRKKLEGQLQQAQKMEAIGTPGRRHCPRLQQHPHGHPGQRVAARSAARAGSPGHEKVQNIEKYVGSGDRADQAVARLARRGKYNVKATYINDIMEKSASLFARTKKEIQVHHQLDPKVWTGRSTAARSSRPCSTSIVNASASHARRRGALLDDGKPVPGRKLRARLTR